MNEKQQRPVVAILWMLVTGLLFVGVTATVKHLGTDVPAPEAAFLRYALGLVFLVPMLKPLFRAGLSRRDHGLFALRGAMHTLGVTSWFFAMTQIPIAEVTALNYVSPVFVTILAAVFLGETLATRRILAVLAALVGAVIVLRPGFREIELGHLAMIGTALAFSGSYLIAKYMADRVEATVVVAMLSITVTIGLAPLAWIVWVPPTAGQLGWLFLVAALATAGHYTMTLALGSAPVAVTQPVTFLQLVWAVLLGAVFFAEPLDGWVVLGGAIILGAISFITWREAVLRKRALTPVALATKV